MRAFPKAKALLPLSLACGLSACGSSDVTVTVQIAASSLAQFDPYAVPNMSAVRVTIDGPERGDDAVLDIGLEARTAEFKSFPGDRAVTIEVSGVDEQGTLLAFGRAEGVRLDGDTSVDIAFRRSLAYVTHRQICNGGCRTGEACVDTGIGFACQPTSDGCANCADTQACIDLRTGPACYTTNTRRSRGPSQLYVIDAVSRGLVDRVALPVTDGRARGVTPVGGRGIAVTYSTPTKAYAGLLSADDNSWQTVELSRPQDLAIVSNGTMGAAAGGGVISIFDFATGTVISETPAGGRAVDAAVGLGGRKGIIILSASPGVVLIDFERPDEAIVPPGEVDGAAGVALSEDGRIAFVTSSADGSVVSVDMDTGAIQELDNSFTGAVQNAVYSDRLQAVFAIENRPENNVSRVLGYSVLGRQSFDISAAVNTLPEPSGIAAVPGGRRLIVVSAGTSTRTAGLTVIDADPAIGPDGSTIVYPSDPDDTFNAGSGFLGQQTYQPNKVAILYGR